MVTWIVGIILALAAGAALWKIIADKKAGKSACGGDCSHCRGCR